MRFQMPDKTMPDKTMPDKTFPRRISALVKDTASAYPKT